MGGGLSRPKAKTRTTTTTTIPTEAPVISPPTPIPEAVPTIEAPIENPPEATELPPSLHIESSSAQYSVNSRQSLSHPVIYNVANELVFSSIAEGSVRTSQRHPPHQSPQVPPLSSFPLSLQPLTTMYELYTPRDRMKSPNDPSSNESPQLTALNYEANIPYTPTGEEADIYKYYCPLCMLYFKTILKSKCCGNYICLLCTKDYLQTKHVYDHNNNTNNNTNNHHLHHHTNHSEMNINSPPSSKKYETIPPASSRFLEFIKENILLNEINCPHCFTNGFHIHPVTTSEKVRDYSMRLPIGSSSYEPQPSPIRIGESFEELKRKMIPFKVLSHSNSTITENFLPTAVVSFNNHGNSATSITRLSLQVEELQNGSLSARSRASERDRSGSSRVAGIAITAGNESPLLSPQSTYRSRENSPTTGYRRHHQNELDYSSADALSPTNLFSRTAPLNTNEEEDRDTPLTVVFRRNSRGHSAHHLTTSMDEISESVDTLDDSLAGMRILARKEKLEHDVARDMVRGVFDTAFYQRQTQISQ